MAVFRVERTRDYTVMCNHHLKDSNLSLKAKGLLSMMLSLPDEWNYTTRGLAAICKEGVDAIGKTLKELELAGYIIRRQLRGKDGRISDTEYTIFEKPRKPSPPDTTLPDTENPYLDMVRSVDVARHMEVSKPSVCHAVATLRDGGFLMMDEDHFLHLTDVGREVAERIYERHRFFTEQLIAAGVDPKTAEADACRIEHTISQDSFEKIRRAHEQER